VNCGRLGGGGKDLKGVRKKKKLESTFPVIVSTQALAGGKKAGERYNCCHGKRAGSNGVFSRNEDIGRPPDGAIRKVTKKKKSVRVSVKTLGVTHKGGATRLKEPGLVGTRNPHDP